jgi:hypothetical protein
MMRFLILSLAGFAIVAAGLSVAMRIMSLFLAELARLVGGGVCVESDQEICT